MSVLILFTVLMLWILAVWLPWRCPPMDTRNMTALAVPIWDTGNMTALAVHIYGKWQSDCPGSAHLWIMTVWLPWQCPPMDTDSVAALAVPTYGYWQWGCPGSAHLWILAVGLPWCLVIEKKNIFFSIVQLQCDPNQQLLCKISHIAKILSGFKRTRFPTNIIFQFAQTELIRDKGNLSRWKNTFQQVTNIF